MLYFLSHTLFELTFFILLSLCCLITEGDEEGIAVMPDLVVAIGVAVVGLLVDVEMAAVGSPVDVGMAAVGLLVDVEMAAVGLLVDVGMAVAGGLLLGGEFCSAWSLEWSYQYFVKPCVLHLFLFFLLHFPCY
jgi:hypothetical protein